MSNYEKGDEILVFHILMIAVQMLIDTAKIILLCMITYIFFCLTVFYLDKSGKSLSSGKEFMKPHLGEEMPENVFLDRVKHNGD